MNSDPKPRIIRDSEIDHILEQVQETREKENRTGPVNASDDQLDAILSELGINAAPKRTVVSPVLLPRPVFTQQPAASPVCPEPPRPAPAQAPPPPPPQPPEPETHELPNIKAYAEAEAKKQAQAREQLLEQARREAVEQLRREAEEKGTEKKEPDKPAPRPDAPAQSAAPQPPAESQAENTPPPAAPDPFATGNQLFGEVDDRFRDFFTTSVIDAPDGSARRKKDKNSFFSKLFARHTEEGEGAEQGEYYESTTEGFTGEFEKLPDLIEDVQAIKNSKAPVGTGDINNAVRDMAQKKEGKPGRQVSISPSIVARAITGTDSLALGTKEARRDGYTVDIDIPISRTRTGEYGAIRPKDDSAPLMGEAEIEEYGNLSDAPVVAGELGAMCETRLVRTCFTGVLTLFLLYLGLSAREGGLPAIPALDPKIAPLTYLVTNLVLLAAVAFSSLSTLAAGLRGLFQRPTTDSFAALAALAAIVQNVALLCLPQSFGPETVTLFSPIAALLLCGNALGKWIQLRAVCANFALASSGDEHEAAFMLEKDQLAKRLCDGTGEANPHVLLNRPTALVKGFLRQSFSAHALDDYAQKLSWGIAASALICAVVGALKGGAPASLSAFAGAMCLAAPLGATLAYALPMDLLQRAAARCGAVVPGPSAVKTLRSANTVLLRARELFPAGSVRLHGIKTFEKERIDIAILYAASMLAPRCETLRGVFMGILDNNEKLLLNVKDAAAEIGFGFTGWIDQRRVLLGSREMMKRHNVELPSVDYERRYTQNGKRSAIYMAVAGKIFGMYIVGYQPGRRGAESIKWLADSDVTVLVQADDFNITAPLVTAVYDLPDGAVKVLSQSEQDALSAELAYRPESEGVMIHSGACASLLGGLHAASQFTACERFAGVALMTACMLGAVVAVALSFYQGLGGLSFGIVLCYQLVWTAVVSAALLLKKP